MTIRRTYLWLTVFSIAMALLETAVVVYLRKIYYPGGFDFPLKLMDKEILIVELFREFATLIMLLSIGVLAGRTNIERFGMFLYSFAVWDIFYYIFLKIFLDWPQSFLTWDILFLIPTTWTGPVLTPIIVSLSMILFALLISFFTTKDLKVYINRWEWALLVFGSLILIIGFCYDYSLYILKAYKFKDIFSIANQNGLFDYAMKYVPIRFPWSIFVIGQLAILTGIGIFVYRNFAFQRK